MNRYRLLVAVLAVSVGVAGCSRKGGPVPDPGKGAAPGSDFCKAVVAFRVDSAVLNTSLNGDAPTAVRAVNAAHADLVKLLATPAPPDIKGDVQLIADTFAAIAANLATVKAGDITRYLAAVNKAEPDTKRVNAAGAALDAYVPIQCGLTTSPDLTTTTPTSTPTTTLAPSGPVLSTTAPGPSAASTPPGGASTTTAGG
jgi:hypothetical protein